jgi:endoglycosylceramidase
MRRALLTLALLLVAAAPATAEPIAHAGRWMVDGDGKVLIVHGVNMPSKWGPATPDGLGFGEDDAQLISSLGFNAVRLTVERYKAEPKPGQFDDAYLAHFADTIRLLADHGLFALVDFHQDEWGPTFMDNGFPDWMTFTDGLPNLYEVGFPGQYVANPALNRAFDHFWKNDDHLQDEDAAILAHVAARLKDAPGLLGWEVINEPWPGTAYPRCFHIPLGCPGFDKGAYSGYYAKTIPAIRAADPKHLIWYEPLVSFNYGVPTHVTPPKDPELGFAFHDYGLCSASSDSGLPVSFGTDCGAEDKLVLSNAERHSAATGSALMETEFGATHDTAAIGQQLGAYDQHMVPWMFWSYTSYVDHTDANGNLLPASDANVDQAIASTLGRPYPRLVAGTPEAWSYDPAAHTLTAKWSTTRAGGGGSFGTGAVTEIAAPAIAYPHGYTASVSGGHVVSDADAPVLLVAQDAGAQEVSATVRSR